jgi:hypothetical protein
MRPDLISPELTPNLAALSADGIVFEANHAIVPTVTRINAATLATGAPPSVHGLPGNVFFAPAVDRSAPISVGEGDNVARLREAYGVFAAPTIADVIRANGGRTAIVSRSRTNRFGGARLARADVDDRARPPRSTARRLLSGSSRARLRWRGREDLGGVLPGRRTALVRTRRQSILERRASAAPPGDVAALYGVQSTGEREWLPRGSSSFHAAHQCEANPPGSACGPALSTWLRGRRGDRDRCPDVDRPVRSRGGRRTVRRARRPFDTGSGAVPGYDPGRSHHTHGGTDSLLDTDAIVTHPRASASSSTGTCAAVAGRIDR